MSEAPNEIWCDTGLYYEYKTDWSEGSWRNNDNCGGVKYVRADRIEEFEERLKAATDDAKAAEAYAEELEATLRKLEYWFDTDQEILDVMGNNEKADHMRKLKMIRDALKGDSDD